jgi:ABC-type sugar transport system substrate-binding protein
VIALLLAACSSSSKSSTSSTTSGGSSATTASGGGASPTTASSSSSGSGLAAAQQYVAQATAQPVAITDKGKITGAIPKGKTVYFIPCGPNPECQQEGQLVKQAATLMGWTTVIVPNDGSPQQSKAAFAQVVRAKPAGVLYTAIPLATFQSYVPQLKANGTVVSACCVTDPTGTGIDYNIDGPAQSALVGGLLSAFVASDSQCKSNDSVYVNIPDFAILSSGLAAYKTSMQKYCPGATVNELDIALADIANASTTIVSYVRSHPSVKYVVASTDGLTIGLPGALSAAGLAHNVKLVGQGATPTNLQYLHSGQQVADVAFPYYEIMYSMLGAVAQKQAGEPITASTAPPQWLLTPQNAPTSTAAVFPVVPNYQQQYKTLWGMG